MSRAFSKFLWAGLFGLVLNVAAGAESGWQKVKAGMSISDTAAMLGPPLIKSRGRGYEVLTYDRGAEVVCYRGLVVAWTPPAGTPQNAGRDLDFRPVVAAAVAAAEQAKRTPPAPVYVPRGESGPGYERGPFSRVRLPRF